jgi:hypothetical protein
MTENLDATTEAVAVVAPVVVVCGSRFQGAGFDTMLAVSLAISRRINELPQDAVVVTGGASGADWWAHNHAGHRGLARRVIRADWDRYGKRAGVIRNIQMLDERPDLVIAFWDGESRGTAHTIREARKRGIPVEVIGNNVEVSPVGRPKSA